MTYNQWEIVLLPFPYTDLSAKKRRPGVILSPTGYDAGADVVILFLTSNLKSESKPGDYELTQWEHANLPKPSKIRMKFMTLDKSLILKKIGLIHPEDVKGIKKKMARFFDL